MAGLLFSGFSCSTLSRGYHTSLGPKVHVDIYMVFLCIHMSHSQTENRQVTPPSWNFATGKARFSVCLRHCTRHDEGSMRRDVTWTG